MERHAEETDRCEATPAQYAATVSRAALKQLAHYLFFEVLAFYSLILITVSKELSAGGCNAAMC